MQIVCQGTIHSQQAWGKMTTILTAASDSPDEVIIATLVSADSQNSANMDLLLEAQDREPVISQLKDWENEIRLSLLLNYFQNHTSGHSGKCTVHYN